MTINDRDYCPGSWKGASGKPPINNGKAPILNLVVTADQINSAVRRNAGHCMIAEAVKVAAPWGTSIGVDLQTIRVSCPELGLRYVYLTPRHAQQLLVVWDQGLTPEPFEVKLRNGAVTRSRAKQYAAARARRSIQVNPRGGEAPVVDGGVAPPVGGLATGRGRNNSGGRLSSRREFGLRGLKK